MILRRLHQQDLLQINSFWEKHHKNNYGIPKRTFVVTDAVTTSKNRVVGYGIVRMFAEALLYLDRDISKFQQAKSFKLLMEQALIDSKQIGLDQLNVGVADDRFRDLLISGFGFKPRETMLFKEF
jgi:hypothetical protein